MLKLFVVVCLVAGCTAGASKKPVRRLIETISRGNGTVIKKLEETYYDEDGFPKTRGVIEDGPYGGNGGGAWTDGGEIHLNGLPSGVDIRSGSRLDGLRMKYGDVYSDWHGGGGGGAHTCEWDADDRVIIVQGRAGSEVDEIEFITTGGVICGPFGGGGGGTWVSTHPGCVLEYLSGNSGSRVDSLTIHWSC